MDYKFQYHMLVESIRLVAALFVVQRKVIPDYAVLADEVAMTFYDGYLLIPQLVREKFVSDVAFEAIKKLYELIDLIPNDGSYATDESLRDADLWQKARELAAEAISALGEEIKTPDLSFVFYTEGEQN